MFVVHGFDFIVNIVEVVFYSEGEVGEVVGTIANVYLEAVEPERVLLEGEILRNIDWLVVLRDLCIINL